MNLFSLTKYYLSFYLYKEIEYLFLLIKMILIYKSKREFIFYYKIL
jgi:hypothetical protein